MSSTCYYGNILFNPYTIMYKGFITENSVFLQKETKFYLRKIKTEEEPPKTKGQSRRNWKLEVEIFVSLTKKE